MKKREGVGVSLLTHNRTSLGEFAHKTHEKMRNTAELMIKHDDPCLESFERLPECYLMNSFLHGSLIKRMELSLTRLDATLFFVQNCYLIKDCTNSCLPVVY